MVFGAVVLLRHLQREMAVGLTAGGTTAFGDDAINFWAAARLAIEGHVSDVYDFAVFHAFQTAALGGPIHLYHYSYPPPAILLCLPLGMLSYVWGVAAWFAGGWLVFSATLYNAWPHGKRAIVDCALYSLAIPAVWLNWLTGQSGTWTAALLGGGLIVIDRRPVLAGVLLGALVAKPQMAFLVPAALIAGRHWKTLATCAATAAALVAASVAVFGAGPWWAFAGHEPVLRHRILEDGTGVWLLFVSVFVSVRHLPASLPVAYGAQGIACLTALILVLRTWHSSAPQAAKNAVLVMSGFFATPYIQVYDLVVTALVPVWLLQTLGDTDPRRQSMLHAAVPLVLAPVLTPVVAELGGINIGWMLLFPAFGVAARTCLRGPTGQGI